MMMRFLSVADRELRAAARRKATYRTRCGTAAIFFGLLIWLLWVFKSLPVSMAAQRIFLFYSFLAFLYCAFLGAVTTADCISSERREGTLGFLFLTNLNSAEIIAGKLCSSSLAALYGFMAVFPMLALPLLMGGIPFRQFGEAVAALLCGILFSLAAGLLSSVVCKRQFVAIGLALGITFGLGGGLMIAAAAADSYVPTKPLAQWIAVWSPLNAMISVGGVPVFGPNRFWVSVACVIGLSVSWVALATLVLSLSWRDSGQTRGFWLSPLSWRPLRGAFANSRTAFRRRALDQNPISWLAAREPVSAPVFMLLAVILTLLTVYVTAPVIRQMVGTAFTTDVFAQLMAWLFTGLAMHALALYYAAMISSQRLAEDKQAGALELILCTPVDEPVISGGLRLAFRRKMLFPALLAILVHFFVIWQCLVMATFDPPAQIPPGSTPGEVFWSVLLDRPLRGVRVEWVFVFLLRTGLLILALVVLAWATLGSVGRWLGLRMKHPGFAPIASLALLVAPPVLVFTFVCILGEQFHLDRLPEKVVLPFLMWLGFFLAAGHFLTLGFWARKRLREGLRPVAMSRYAPLPAWRWRLPSLRWMWRVGAAAAAVAALAALVAGGYYFLQNRRGAAEWKSFQKALATRGESLDLPPLLPAPVPDAVNFARSPAFLSFTSGTNLQARELLGRMADLDRRGWAPQPFPPAFPQGFARGISPSSPVLLNWPGHEPAPLRPHLAWIAPRAALEAESTRHRDAAAVLKGLEPVSVNLQDLADAARAFPAFQLSTNRDARAVISWQPERTHPLERMALIFQVRACALLESGRCAEAAEDILAALRLAGLARQLPDVRSPFRAQTLLAQSLQPLWEGLSRNAWTDPQLASFQKELASFNLLADYTNAVRRTVLAHIELWRAIPENPASNASLPRSYPPGSDWQLVPRSWWLENCIRLYEAGQAIQKSVDGETGKIQSRVNWGDLNGLQLDPVTWDLLQQVTWPRADPGHISFAQSSLAQALIACALERFRLAKGAYPASLEEIGASLPPRARLDAVTGRPMMYLRIGDGGFTLRGAGPDGRVETKPNPSDDWIWAYSSNVPAAVQ